ncbi:MAG: chemotaxis protein CheW [Gammaproteobacteria bacterium]|nr:chemotaxis protein CheW [Gammaproteobacteria bacterium]
MARQGDKAMSNQQQAINDYLQALLQDANDTDAVEDTQIEQIKPVAIGLEKLVAEIPEIVVEAKPETLVEEKIVAATETEVVKQAKAPVAEDSEVPEWAQQAFQCLLFNVSGLNLAVPLEKLNSVIPWTDKIVETPNQTDWYLGLVNNLGKNVKVIDTALMVMPENRRVNITQPPGERFSHILLVDDNQWGLACDSIGDVIWLTAKEVKWRTNKTLRPWLAGTALERLCALIDSEMFAEMLNEKNKVT